MSNKDSNGLELPWILYQEKELGNPDGFLRYKIIPNKLWKHAELNSDAFALMSCFRDAVINLNSFASSAIMLHIQDAHKWKD